MAVTRRQTKKSSTNIIIKTSSKNSGLKKQRTIIPKVIPSPVKVYTSNIGRSRANALRWEVPEWDLTETGRILDTESYFRRACKNKKNLFLKEGYDFVGPNLDRVIYVRKRIRQMEEATNLPFEVLISQASSSLTRASNAFWVKARKDKASGGKVRVNANGKKLDPIAGYFPLPAETVRFKRDEYGKIKKYMQEVYGKTAKEFAPEDVVHFCFNKREGYAVGTPDVVAVKDDIRALRRIEENIELLLYQHLFPLFHYQVGTEKQPAAVFSDGSSEVEDIQLKVAHMPSDGCWVTPERHKITPLQADGPPIAVDKVIAHFKQRIFTGLGLSSVDMGESGSSNRSTAQTLSRNLIDDTKADQKEFASQFKAYIIKELLLESTFSELTLFEDENLVNLKFKEIDFESRQAKENHFVDMFEKNAITHDEMRLELGYDPFEGEGWPTSSNKAQMIRKGDGDWARTNYGIIGRDKVILQSLDEPGTDASKSETKSRTVQNKNKPANQHGVRSSTKINKDSFGTNNPISTLDVVFNQRAPFQSIYKDLQVDVTTQIRYRGFKSNEVKLLIGSAFARAKDYLVSLSQKAYRIGLRNAGVEVWQVQLDKADILIHDHINKYTGKLRKTLLSTIERNTIKNIKLKSEDAIITGLVFDSLKHRTAMLDNSEIMRAYNYGKVSGYRVLGAPQMKSFRHGNTACDICDKHILFYKESNVIIYDELPPFHPHCTCEMVVG